MNIEYTRQKCRLFLISRDCSCLQLQLQLCFYELCNRSKLEPCLSILRCTNFLLWTPRRYTGVGHVNWEGWILIVTSHSSLWYYFTLNIVNDYHFQKNYRLWHYLWSHIWHESLKRTNFVLIGSVICNALLIHVIFLPSQSQTPEAPPPS